MSNKFTTQSFLDAKLKKEKITMLTAYDYSMAQIIDTSGIDSILVGDSLGMVMQGHHSTLDVTMDDMVYHCRCVSRGVKNALLIGDMPFLSYHTSTEEAVKNAGRLIQEGKANAVKLEGGKNMIEPVKAIVRAQIPVMGHIGLTPQSVNIFGGYKVQGKNESKARALIEDALALEEAGVFSIVLEAVPEELARIITEKVKVPTIGIGAGRYCDGQVLVINDILGMFSDFTPKFVKQYAHLKANISEAVNEYIQDVKEQRFPEKEHTFTMDESILQKLHE
ncbi:MAG: 3-methyl-2-oxobutanoate hydroxymethyltransferase [Clostridia bacterium]|nr:3-methyl-2-oxobutanoate hydroxymethyltransferase [Clostridia bacterium]